MAGESTSDAGVVRDAFVVRVGTLVKESDEEGFVMRYRYVGPVITESDAAILRTTLATAEPLANVEFFPLVNPVNC